MSNETKYIPALKFHMLTDIYDPVIRIILPERKLKKRMVGKLGLTEGKVLDFGCGTATLSIITKKKYKDVSIIGVDIDPKVLSIAEKNIKKAGQKIELKLYNGTRIPFEDNYFDRAMTSLVFHHLTQEQKKAALKELYRVVKPGGEIHIADFCKPKNFLMQIFAEMFKYMELTEDNIRGRIPMFAKEAGFEEGTETDYFNSFFGTLSVFKGRKPVPVKGRKKEGEYFTAGEGGSKSQAFLNPDAK